MAVWAAIEKAFDNYQLADGSYSKTANASQGTASAIGYSQGYASARGRAGIRLSGIAALLGADGGVTAVRITCSSNVGGGASYANLCALNEDISAKTASAAWSAMTAAAGNVLGAAENGALLDITDAASISKITQYGLFLDHPAPAAATVYARYCWIYAATAVQILYYSAKTPAQAEIVTPAELSNQIGNEPISVTWTFSHEIAGVTQYAYKIEYSIDEGLSWTTLEDTTGAATSCTIPADTLPDGQARLRLTVYTQDPDTSARIAAETQEVTFNVRSNPSTSDVECDGKPHPTVSWTGADQSAYQVRFADWDSGAIFGAETELTIPRVYAAGVYPVTVRTQTSNGDWSDWAETLWAEITNVDPGLSTALTVTQSGPAALCTWTAAAGAVGYILLRDGAPIWAGTDTWFRDDFAGAGAAVYMLRILADTGYYTDSAPVTAALQLRCDVLRPLDDAEAGWLKIRYSLAPRSRSYDRSIATTFRHYAGRPKPVAISDGASTRTMRTTAAFKTRAEAEALMALAGRPVLYKDYNGGTIIGILDPVGTDSERVYSADLSVTEIDWPDDLDAQVEAIFDAPVYHVIPIDVDAETVYGMQITSSNKWNTAANWSWMLAVPAGTTHLRITAASTSNLYALLQTNDMTAGAAPDFCADHTGRAYLSEGTNLIELPADCHYVYVSIRYSGGAIKPTAAQWEGTYV